MQNISLIYLLCYENYPPPANTSDIKIIIHIRELYKRIYLQGNKLSKKDKLGIHKTIEQLCLSVFSLVVQATYANKSDRVNFLAQTRIKIEIIKNLIRIKYDLKIISEKQYWGTSNEIIELSKMVNGWIKYLENKKYS